MTAPDEAARSSAARAEPLSSASIRVGRGARGWITLDATALHDAAGAAPDAASPAEDEIGLQARANEAWRAVAGARPIPDDGLAQLERDARRLGAPDLVIEVAVLRALAWAGAGELLPALECARRAFRMGRTERLPESEHLAAIVLSRLRRSTGHPYLATRIATALRRFVPREWHPWIDWEITMASGQAPPSAAGPAALLRELLAHASAGAHPELETTLAELHARIEGFAPLLADLRRVHAAIDPGLAPDIAAPELAAWCRAESPFQPPPMGLAGLDVHDGDDASGIGVAFVLARPQGPGRRFLRIGVALAERGGASAALTRGRVGRAEGVLSALALAGPEGLPKPELFRSVYGFSYSPALHRGAFDVALHRARTRLENLGTLERDDERIRLLVQHPFVVPDPRSAPATEDRVLERLARAGEVSAKELSQALAMPLRTVQDSLRSLVEGGACIQHRAGRRVVYALEDTTFQEPTRA